MKLNVARFLERTCSEGPGWRAAIWVQGCPILCPGCCNPHMLPFVDRHWDTTEAIAERILAISDIEGVSFLGGEPFAQASALAEVAQRVRQAGLSVACFTGYTLEDLHQHIEAGSMSGWADLLAQCDMLLAGPFIQARYTTTHPWIGSDNQQIHYLTDRYRHLEGQNIAQATNTVEVHFSADGHLAVNGFAYAGVLPALKQALRAQGFSRKASPPGDHEEEHQP